MEHKAVVRLVPQAKLIEQGAEVGILCAGVELWAKDSRQAMLLRELAASPKSVYELEEMLKTAQDAHAHAQDVPLALADFILRFGQVLTGEFSG